MNAFVGAKGVGEITPAIMGNIGLALTVLLEKYAERQWGIEVIVAKYRSVRDCHHFLRSQGTPARLHRVTDKGVLDRALFSDELHAASARKGDVYLTE